MSSKCISLKNNTCIEPQLKKAEFAQAKKGQFLFCVTRVCAKSNEAMVFCRKPIAFPLEGHYGTCVNWSSPNFHQLVSLGSVSLRLPILKPVDHKLGP